MSVLTLSHPSSSYKQIIIVAAIAAGLQFGWALQLSLLTPYVQQLGVPRTWSSFIWLCGPMSGLIVQPTVGYYSDRCSSRFGRRRPFIVAGAVFVAVAVILIGFAADIGHSAGDELAKRTKPRAVAIFVVGFWVLDVANNMLQGPCRALLTGLSLGILNLFIVIPQLLVSAVSGPLDAAFGGGNLPAFVMGGIAAFASSMCAIFLLPDPPPQCDVSLTMGGGHSFFHHSLILPIFVSASSLVHHIVNKNSIIYVQVLSRMFPL